MAAAAALVFCHALAAAEPERKPYCIAVFSADVTIPLGHRCMGILPTKAQRIDDPLKQFSDNEGFKRWLTDTILT
ncbi:MAG TPA: hypothetical protein VFW87_24950 [Pirellulales bacterium]|nr:hypothetical protein [Pirellulales bacterium]